MVYPLGRPIAAQALECWMDPKLGVHGGGTAPGWRPTYQDVTYQDVSVEEDHISPECEGVENVLDLRKPNHVEPDGVERQRRVAQGQVGVHDTPDGRQV